MPDNVHGGAAGASRGRRAVPGAGPAGEGSPGVSPSVARRAAALAAIRDGLAGLSVADGRRTTLRRDRIGFTFPDGSAALVQWYPIRGGRAPGSFELVVGAMIGGGPLADRVAARTGRPQGTVTGWVMAAGSLNGGVTGGGVAYVILGDDDVEPVAERVVRDVRERYAPLIALVRTDPAAAASLLETAPWLTPGPVSEVAAALREVGR